MPLTQLLKASNRDLQTEVRLILNAIIEGLCGLDAAGNVTFCNDAFLRVTGYRTEEVIGNSLHELIHHSRSNGTKCPAAECALVKAIPSHQPIHMLGEFLWRKDGTRFPAQYRAHPLQQPSNTTAYVVTIQDMSECERARNVLRQSEEKFRRILASMTDVAWTSDRDGRTVYISPRVDAVLGYNKQEICAAGTSLRSGLIHPEDFGRVNRAYRALFENQSAYDQEYRIRRKDGAWIWIHDRATGTYLENGVLCADGVFGDVTKRKQEEAELQWKTAFLEAQANSTIDGILVVDSNGRRLLNNQRFIELFQIPPEFLANPDHGAMLKYAATLVRDSESLTAKIDHFKNDPSETSRDEIELKNGTVVDRYFAPVVDKEGKYYGRLLTFRDITERQRAEEALKASEKRYRRLFERNLAGVLRTTVGGRILECNQATARMFGFNLPEEVRMLSVLDFYHQSLDREEFLTRLRSEKSVTNYEMRLRRKDGDAVWVLVNLSLVEDDSSTGASIEGTLVDITERKRAEEELYVSRQMLQSILDAIPQRVFWKDRNSNYLGCNRAFARDAGVESAAAIIGKNDFDLVWSQMAGLYRADDKLVMEQESPKLNFQHRESRPDGSVWLQTNKLPLRNWEGKVSGVVGTYEDISERKRAEREFRLTQFSLEHASDPVEWIDAEGHIVYVNQADCRALGRSREEVLSLSIPDIDPLFSKEVWRAFWSDLKARGSMTFETRRRSNPERVFPVEVTATYLEFDGQEYCFALLRDITEHKRADRELRMTKSSLENTTDTLLWLDPQARILYANDAVCRSLGYSREEILSMSITDVDPHFPQERWARFWEECKARGSMTFEAHNGTKQGRVFPVEVTATYVEFDGQEYCFAFGRDISERRELESQLRHAQKLEGIGQLSSGIAHEINTPIQFVADNLTFLRDSWKSTHALLARYRAAIQNAAEMALSPEVLTALKQAEQECDLDFIVAEVPRAIDQGLDGAYRVAKIVRAMKEFSHPDSAEKTATDLNKAIESTITVARNEWKYVAELATDFDVNLPAVVCYPGDINQVILNLVVNGAHAIKEKVKDGEKGRITVCTRMRGEFAEIAISDTGTGIPEAIRSRIFDPFFTTKEVGKGTGQGLSLAHTVVVKKHSGKIWFETEVGVGTTFFIDLPIKLADHVGTNNA